MTAEAEHQSSRAAKTAWLICNSSAAVLLLRAAAAAGTGAAVLLLTQPVGLAGQEVVLLPGTRPQPRAERGTYMQRLPPKKGLSFASLCAVSPFGQTLLA